jgi:sugar (pentulose or hexulose) kinase
MKEIGLGVDVGSTSIKAVALEVDSRRVVNIVSSPLTSVVHGTAAGHHEEDPLRIRQQAWELIRELAAIHGEAITRIAFTGQMHSGMFVDRDLNPLTNLVTWQDKRGDESLSSDLSFAEAVRLSNVDDPTGVGIHTGFLCVTALWYQISGFTPPSGSRIIGIYDWLTSFLIGRAVTDITSAAAWGVYDIVGKKPKEQVLTACRLSTEMLPDVLEPGSCIGLVQPIVAKELTLAPSTKVYASIGDTQASYLGAGTESSEVLLNFGTGSQSMWQTDLPIASEGTDIRYLLDGRYIATAPTLAGGKAYQILADFYASVLAAFGHEIPESKELYEVMNKISANSGTNGLTFDPIFSGSRWRESDARAMLKGISATNFEAGPVTRALLAGMIEEVAAPYFLREASGNHSRIRGAGNGMRRNPTLRALAAERFKLPLVLSSSEEEAATGAALLTLPPTA